MALLGSTIDPRLMMQDYSGIAKAGETQGQMYAQMGKDIGGAIKSGAEAYGQVKQFQGQRDAFGKSMDYMAKAFPDKADMFNEAKSAVFNPNANMIEQAAAMSGYQSQLDMINKMQQEEMMMRQRQQQLDMQKASAASQTGSSNLGELPL
jgi:hypothetical protein